MNNQAGGKSVTISEVSGDLKGDSTIEIQRVKETVVESGPPKTVAVGGEVSTSGGSNVDVKISTPAGAGVATNAI